MKNAIEKERERAENTEENRFYYALEDITEKKKRILCWEKLNQFIVSCDTCVNVESCIILNCDNEQSESWWKFTNLWATLFFHLIPYANALQVCVYWHLLSSFSVI